MLDTFLSIALMAASINILILYHEIRKMKRLMCFIGVDLAKRGYLGEELKQWVDERNNKTSIKL